MNWFENIGNIYRLTSFFLSIGLLIGALEDLYTFPIFQSNGLLSWKVSRVLLRWSCKGGIAKCVHFFLNDFSFKMSIYLRIVGSTLLFVFALFNVVSPVLFIALLVLNMFVFLRTPYSLDGGYQMSIMVLLGTSLGSLWGLDSKLAQFGLFFIGAQLAACYMISGVTKLVSPIWRRSYAMNAVFATKTYGHPFIYNLISRSPWIGRFATWSVILFEILFFTVFFFNPWMSFLFLFMGFLFHLGNAIFMGLNDFLFAFLAAYPAFVYLIMILKS